MTVEIAIALSAPEIPVLGTLDVRVLLRNTGPLPLELPGENDRTPALTFDVFDRDTRELVRRMNGFSHQALLSRARISSEHALEVVPGGGALDFTLDLAQFHQPLRAGNYEVQATYAYPPAGVNVASAKVPVRVTDAAVTRMSALRDNPVLDGLTVLVEAQDGSTWGRLHNVDRPLAAWWNRRMELPPGTTGAFAASSGFFQTASFGPFFETWLLFVHGNHLVARAYAWGKPTGEQRAAPLPARGRLISSAVRTVVNRELMVFFWSDGLLEGYRLDAQSLVKTMELPLPRGIAGEPCVRADEDFLHVVYPDHGLIHTKIGLRGQASSSDRVHRTGMHPVWWVYEPPLRRTKAVFVDSPWGRAFDLYTSDGNGVSVRKTQLPVRGHVTEIAFDRNQRGQTFILFGTSRRKLYLIMEDRAPALIAAGQDRYFPLVMADAPASVAYFKPGYGHRFFGYTVRQHTPHVIDYETEAWVKP